MTAAVESILRRRRPGSWTWGMLALALAFGLTPPAPGAEEPPSWYQIDLIVFKHRQDSEPGSSESWPRDPGRPSIENALELVPESAPASWVPVPRDQPSPLLAAEPFRILAEEDRSLTSVYASLQRSSIFEPVIYLAWRQPVQARERARPVRVHGGMVYARPHAESSEHNSDRPAPLSSDSRTAVARQGWGDAPGFPAQPDLESIADPAGSAFVEEFEGTVTLSVARYLHVWADLVYSQPAPPSLLRSARDAVPPLDRFRMQSHRRMRSNELHYLDHPRFGLLIQLTPFEPPRAEEEPLPGLVPVEVPAPREQGAPTHSP